MMRRRDFITLLGGAAAWPLAVRAQQDERMSRLGVLTGLAEDDPENQARLAGFRHGLEKRGWWEGRNLRVDYRFAPAVSSDQIQLSAKELVALRPDVIFAQATPVIAALQRETRAIPIVFAAVADPIGSGSRKRPDPPRPCERVRACHGATGVKRHDQDNPSRDRDAQIGRPKNNGLFEE